MRSLEWALILYECHPYKMSKFGHRYVQQKDDSKKRRRQPFICQRERPETNPLQILNYHDHYNYLMRQKSKLVFEVFQT